MSADAGPLLPPPTRLLTGDEPITGTSASVRNFWAWALSDLRTNTVRPVLYEGPADAVRAAATSQEA
ncbi:hypothetical protein SAMN05660748_3039 [Blastococcus aggregatus]|uniref:Uncharacterized protein n=1 Tax=Blastococcus aggregatus TaxID=38502 RepID=A0A285V8E3_9ACTN|nr:hypothetical protein SAMN05660748_3039 [Blastococcus aggregatus]